VATPRAPDLEFLHELTSEMQDQYRDQDKQIQAARAVREMQVPALAGADQKYVLVSVDPRDPTVAEEAFQQTAMLTLERPKLQVKAGESEAAQTNSSLREHFTEQTLWTCGTREPGTDTMNQSVDAALNDGGAWCKILWLPDTWEQRYSIAAPQSADDYAAYDRMTEDAKKAAGPPFAWVQVNSASVYPDWSGGQLCQMLEISQRPRRSTLRRYGLGTTREGEIVPESLGQPMSPIQGQTPGQQTFTSTVTFLEFWDETYCAWAVTGTTYNGKPTGQIVKAFQHGYPFGVPYDVGYGLMMNHWRNRKIGWGISETKRWLIEYRQYLRAMHAQYVARDLLSPLTSSGDSPALPVIGDDGKPRWREQGPAPGEIVHMPSGRRLERIPYPDASTLERHMQLVDNAILQLSSPQVTSLGGLEGAGFAISQVLSYARVRIGPVKNNLESMLKGQTEKLWALIREKAKETVYVSYSETGKKQGYLGVGPEDLDATVGIEWDVQAQLPTDDLIKARYAHERLAAGTWGKDEAITYLGDNPDEIRRSLARDRIRQTPQYQQWLDSQIFMEAGRGDILAKAAQAEQLALGGALPAGGPPGMPAPAQPGLPNPAAAPGVFEGAPGQVPDLGALAAAPNGRGVRPPPYQAVVGGPPGGPPPR
jgi:hypothetical protein